MKHKNNDLEKIKKGVETFKNTMKKRKEAEIELFNKIPLKQLLIENIVFNTQCKCPTFIEPFHMKYNNFSSLLKLRTIKEINYNSKFLINLRYFYFGLEENNCKYCGKKTDFISISKGYKNFCKGYICCNNYIINNVLSNEELLNKTLKKRKETFFSRTKEEISNSYKQGHLTKLINGTEKVRLEKIRKTNEKKGKWINLKELPDYEVYKRLVESFTEKNYKKFKKEINPLNLHRTRADKNEKGYHLDHIIPKKIGFEKGILPYIIGSKENLQMLSIQENSSKQDALTNEAIILLNDIVYS